MFAYHLTMKSVKGYSQQTKAGTYQLSYRTAEHASVWGNNTEQHISSCKFQSSQFQSVMMANSQSGAPRGSGGVIQVVKLQLNQGNNTKSKVLIKLNAVLIISITQVLTLKDKVEQLHGCNK